VLPILPADFIEALVTITMVEGMRSETVDLRLEPGDRRAKVVAIPSLSEQPPPVDVATLVIRGDGSTFAGPAIRTADPVVIVRDREGTFRQVAVRLLAGPVLADHGLMAVQVQLVGADDEPLDTVIFTESQRGVGQLLVPAGNGGPPPRYRAIRYALDGSADAGTPQAITSAELLVPAVVAR
jgi:hypothetical protein